MILIHSKHQRVYQRSSSDPDTRPGQRSVSTADPHLHHLRPLSLMLAPWKHEKSWVAAGEGGPHTVPRACCPLDVVGV